MLGALGAWKETKIANYPSFPVGAPSFLGPTVNFDCIVPIIAIAGPAPDDSCALAFLSGRPSG